MVTINYKAAHQKIEKDIKSGVYKNFKALRSNLSKVSDKLLKLEYVVNADELTKQEVNLLKENFYI